MMNHKKLPIGYYLKKADNLLTEGINAVHTSFGIDRTDWQILNTVYENPGIGQSQLFAPLLQFESLETLQNHLSKLISFNWIAGKESFQMTDKGDELYHQCLQKQKDFRAKATQGMTEAEYVQLVATLEKIIGNLG